MSKKRLMMGLVFIVMIFATACLSGDDKSVYLGLDVPLDKSVYREGDGEKVIAATVSIMGDSLKRSTVPILMYHAIDEYKGKGINELYVTPANFESQLNYLKTAGFSPIQFDDLSNIQNIEMPILITLDDGYKNNINAFNILKKLNSPSFQAKATIFVIGRKIDTETGLTAEQLKEMSDSGIISVQSHTITHPSLPLVTNFAEELGESKAKIEAITGKKVSAIAYPSGEYDSNVIAETKKYYDYAVTTKPGVANLDASHYEMKRIRINYSTSLAEFESLLNGVSN
ncbi:polysaccharide deacetylase family protein [bacterium LRH843]|nr:polysaccharide deacetylase family protein [bacterium LRH843]